MVQKRLMGRRGFSPYRQTNQLSQRFDAMQRIFLQTAFQKHGYDSPGARRKGRKVHQCYHQSLFPFTAAP